MMAKEVPGIVDCFDIGTWNQIALIEECDLFCSPHTGFAFVAQFVGTPWLTISGCPWAEYLFNGVPFYSALPDCPNYPACSHRDSICMQRWFDGAQPDCMSDEAINRRIPDILSGARLLLAYGFDFKETCVLHIQKLKARNANPDHFRYFDWTNS
jgi:hypothetical protein